MAHRVAADELPLLVRFLATQLPASLKLHGETLGLLHGIDAPHGQGDGLFISPAGLAALHAAGAADGSDLAEVSAAVSRRHYQADRQHLTLSFFATGTVAAADLFALILADLEPPPRSMMIAGLDDQFLPAARAQFGGGHLGLRSGGKEEMGDDSSHWVAPCVMVWRPPPGNSAASDVTPLPDFPVPAGCILGPLCEADSHLVNETWAYGKTEAARLQHVIPGIKNQLSVGLRIEETGELVSWAVGDHPYGAIGKVFTVEAHRRKGYSAVVCAALTKLVAEDASQGQRPRCAAPFCFIVADNDPSVKLFKERLGYVQTEVPGIMSWVGF